jgi:pimeloyl-ACP methyl ester carboxylesterase
MRALLIGLLVIVAVLVGGFLYLNQPDIPRSALEAKYATPPSQFVMLPDGARAHFRDRGPRDAQVLVLLHGSNASLLTWEPWSKSLSDRFRVVSVDLPGHGLTGAVPNRDYSQKGMATFVNQFVDKIGLQKFALGGNSMGGGVAAFYAETYPDRLTHLILVDAGGMPVKQGDRIPLAFKLAGMPWARPILLHITPRSLVSEGLNDAIVRKAVITDAMIDSYWDFARMEGTREATSERFSLGFGDRNYIKDHIGAIKVPTLILWGEQDHLVPVESAHAFNAAIANSKLVVYPATGHIPMEEMAQQSAADVRAFLSSGSQ